MFDFEDLRPQSRYPKYPPYIQNDNGYLETYFFNFYLQNRKIFDATGRTLIPIWWTTLAVDNVQKPIQKYINVLPKSEKWFTVSQLDDGIKYNLPEDTLHFAAGGLGGGIPIPLVCSPLEITPPVKQAENEYLCSFVGSITHGIRRSLYDTYHDKKGFYFSGVRPWSQNISSDNFNEYVNITTSSKFALAPRGYGLSSFRLYEIMQLGVIPVYVSDKHWLPWKEELNWNEFCVIITPNQIRDLEEILSSISEETQIKMKERIKSIYTDYFSLEGVCKQIYKHLWTTQMNLR